MGSLTIIESVLGLILATALGAIVVFEREITHKPAGLRTHMLVKDERKANLRKQFFNDLWLQVELSRLYGKNSYIEFL